MFHFHPWLDLPIAVAMTMGMLLHIQQWIKRPEPEVTVDLRQRLPRARWRILGFFVALCLIGWLANLAVWAIVGFVFLCSFIVTILLTPEQGVSFAGSYVYLLREWAFGFPLFILHTGKESTGPSTSQQRLAHVLGRTGVVVSPLRPCGDVEINDQLYQATSEDGLFVDTGTRVLISGTRNGQLLTRSAPE